GAPFLVADAKASTTMPAFGPTSFRVLPSTTGTLPPALLPVMSMRYRPGRSDLATFGSGSFAVNAPAAVRLTVQPLTERAPEATSLRRGTVRLAAASGVP